MNLGELLDSLTVLCGCRDLTVARQRRPFSGFYFSNTDLYEYIYKERDERISEPREITARHLKPEVEKLFTEDFSTIYFNLTAEIKMQGGLYRMYAFIENVLPSDKRMQSGIKSISILLKYR